MSGDLIMCVVIFDEIREKAVVDTGMNILAAQEGEVRDNIFSKNNRDRKSDFLAVLPAYFRVKKCHA